MNSEGERDIFLVENMEKSNVYRYQNIDFKFVEGNKDLPPEYLLSIKKNWKSEISEGKTYTNGKLFTMTGADISEETIHIYVQETDFAHYLYSRKNDINKYSCRSMAANVLFLTNDNYFVLGRMGASTSLANKVKFIGGSFDKSDLAEDHMIDVNKCIEREVLEEVGISLKNREMVAHVRPFAFLTRKKLSFINILFIAELKITKVELEGIFSFFKANLNLAGQESELSELVYIKNDYESVSAFLRDEKNIVIDYMCDFFEAYFGKLDYGNFRDYVETNLQLK